MFNKADKASQDGSGPLIDREMGSEDEKKWKEFVTYFEQYIYNILRTLGIPRAKTEELCQQIMISLWEEMPKFSHDKKREIFVPSLSTIIHNATVNHLSKSEKKNTPRKGKKRQALAKKHNNPTNSKLEKIIEDEWRIHISNSAWQTVKQQINIIGQKSFIMGIEGISIEKIAGKCGLNHDSIESYKKRIKEALKEEMATNNIKFFQN